MSSSKKSYLTTAIPYVNAAPHIGHALLFIYADIMARYQRLLGNEVRFLTGTDEHGQKIANKAAEQGKTVQAFVDEVSQTVRNMAQLVGMSNTDFIRTTEERHAKAVESFWKRVEANGWIYKKRYGGLYCVGCEQFKTEKDLINGVCPDHKVKPEYIEEENYFFKLSAFQEKLLAWYEAHPEYVVPESRFNEMKRLVEGGLEDMSISRSKERLSWGLPVPGDDTQVIYVWFDALVNYLTGSGFGSVDETEWMQWWGNVTHVLGQEINRFHSILWVAMCMAADIQPPTRFAVHGWITVDGQKMSKSLGNVIAPEYLHQTFGLDGMRFLLAREFVFSSDGDYSDARFRERFNADLANNFGNLVNRTTSMLQKYFGGEVIRQAQGDMSGHWTAYQYAMDHLQFDRALEAAWKAMQDLNQDIDIQKPWTLAKEGKTDHLADHLYNWLESIRHIAWMIRPFMPETSDKILDVLGVTGDRSVMSLDEVSLWGGIQVGQKIGLAPPLFPRVASSSV